MAAVLNSTHSVARSLLKTFVPRCSRFPAVLLRSTKRAVGIDTGEINESIKAEETIHDSTFESKNGPRAS